MCSARFVQCAPMDAHARTHTHAHARTRTHTHAHPPTHTHVMRTSNLGGNWLANSAGNLCKVNIAASQENAACPRIEQQVQESRSRTREARPVLSCAYMHARMHANVYTHIHGISLSVCVCVCVRARVCVRVKIHTHTHTFCTSVRVCARAYVLL